MSPRWERKITLACLAVTALLFTLFLSGYFRQLLLANSAIGVAESVFFLALVMCLLWGNLLYQLARYGYFVRKAAHAEPARADLEQCYDSAKPPVITVLIPSYREELHVLRQTILSAALLDYPQRRIAVLIDNPPNVSGSDLQEIRATREMIEHLNRAFAALARPLQRECDRFRDLGETADLKAESQRLARLYEAAAEHLDDWANDLSAAASAAFAHHDRLLIDRVFKALARDHRDRAGSLRSSCPDAASIAHEFRRLAALFRVEISSFERKRYVNLSHEANKAMNLNSYIGLIGRSFREDYRRNGCWLIECPVSEADFTVPDSDYVLTLDADSVLLPDYALRLIAAMETDPRIAVAQTPYSAFPGAAGSLERIAGATTDLQYIVHQGFTSCEATYWVGANALLRFEALKDIEQHVLERGHVVPVFIQDRTVIEDTDSTVDLIGRGWRLFNYPERLAYSATPPDFGSLAIQRRRWANGGLIILPGLLRYLRERLRFNRMRVLEVFMRTHYLCSPATGSIGLLAILLYPFDDALTTIWLIATAVPYYFLYGRDLRQCGYRLSDVLRVYALVLLLLPVNLSGVFRSLEQIATGRKSPFGRTPKIDGRTASPPRHILFHWGVTAFLIVQIVFGIQERRYSHAAFALANSAAFIYALTYFVGWKNAWTDLSLSLARWWPIQLRPKSYPRRSIPAPALQDRVEKALAASAQEPG